MSHADRKRVVVTGIGAVSPNGTGAEAYAQACIDGISGIVALADIGPTGDSHDADAPARSNAHPLRSWAVGYARAFDPAAALPAQELRRVPRMIPLALTASREALDMAGMNIAPDDLDLQRQIGVALGTGGGGLAFVEEQYKAFFLENRGSLYSITAGTHGNLSSELSIALHLRGPSHVLSTGCTSSTDAIGYAMMLIRAGVIPMMLAGGADAPVSPGILTAFEKMRVVSTRRWDRPTRASRPFDVDRDGFILGEGAWMFILEERQHAIQRGANILAELIGYGSTCDAWHRVQIAPDVAEPVRAIQIALHDADIHPEQIGYINLHGTGTELNDRMETLAIKKAFGTLAPRVPGSSTKSMIGHPQGACGAAGLAATILTLSRGMIHPTINLESPDPHCDLDYTPGAARQTPAKIALCNCIAFGSKNSAIVVDVMKQ